MCIRDRPLCAFYLRFAVPSNCSVSAYGEGWSPYDVFKVLSLESHANEGYSYYTLEANLGTPTTVVYQVKIVRP